MKVTNLSDILSGKQFDALTEAEQTAYLQNFAAFKQKHNADYPNGQVVTIGIQTLNLLPGTDGKFRITLADGVNTSTKVLTFAQVTLDILMGNSVQLPYAVVAPHILMQKNKGSIKMTIKVVDENDEWTGRDGSTGGYTRPQAAIIGNTEYVPSNDVLAACAGAYQQLAALQMKNVLANVEGAKAEGAKVAAASEVEQEVDIV